MKYLAIFLCALTTLFARNNDYKVSVIVPCHWIHAQYLPELMAALSEQTYLPDEVLISLSKTEAMSPEQLQAVRTLCREQPFPVKLLEYPMRRYTGFNRTMCARAASHPLLVHNDADDLPEPNRLERIKWAFDYHDIEALIHSYHCEGRANYTRAEIEPYTRSKMFDLKLHMGSISFLAPLLKSIPWRDSHPGREDKFYVREAAFRGHRIAVLDEDLLYYRNHLSTWGENNDGQM